MCDVRDKTRAAAFLLSCKSEICTKPILFHYLLQEFTRQPFNRREPVAVSSLTSEDGYVDLHERSALTKMAHRLQRMSKQQQFVLMDGLFSRPDCGPVFTGR